MAKGNLFLGTAARSVGDVVMYRREGSQVSRVRVRKIANPKTEAQCRQRAYMAPIPKFFSPLAVVLERSFEGLSKAKSYAKFIKVNADKARANDWLLPKGIGFFPLPYTLSQGTIPSFGYSVTAGALSFNAGAEAISITTIGALSEGLITLGYQAGDVVTLIVVQKKTDDSCYPMAAQFKIDATDTAEISTLLDALNAQTAPAAGNTFALSGKTDNLVAGAIIVSRFENDKWRRSSQSLAVDSSEMSSITTDNYKAAAIASYSASAAGANPMVYLDGDELDNA